MNKTILQNNLSMARIRIRKIAVVAASRVYRNSSPDSEEDRKQVVLMARELEEFILEPDDEK